MSNAQFATMMDMLNSFYGGSGLSNVGKADAPILSSTTGVFNAVYGAQAFSQLNMEGNAFALLPKYPWQHSGYRAITADAGSAADGNISEGAAPPDSIKPTFAQIDVSPKEVAHTFEVSFRQEGLVKRSKDDAFGTMDQARPYFASKHAKAINQMLLTDGDTLASTKFESIDRITASAAYASAVSWTAADEDIYGIDRSAASWADATVSHNSGTDRTLSLDLIESTLGTLESVGARTNVILTHPGTKWRIIGLAQTQVRYQGVVKQDVSARIGLNGVETEEGMGFGVRVASVYGIPMFASQSVPLDTIGRIYLLDTTVQEGTEIPRLGIALLYPTMYFEAGMSAANPNPFIINKFATKGVFYTCGEVVCTFFKAQGSIRDLK